MNRALSRSLTFGVAAALAAAAAPLRAQPETTGSAATTLRGVLVVVPVVVGTTSGGMGGGAFDPRVPGSRLLTTHEVSFDGPSPIFIRMPQLVTTLYSRAGHPLVVLFAVRVCVGDAGDAECASSPHPADDESGDFGVDTGALARGADSRSLVRVYIEPVPAPAPGQPPGVYSGNMRLIYTSVAN